MDSCYKEFEIPAKSLNFVISKNLLLQMSFILHFIVNGISLYQFAIQWNFSIKTTLGLVADWYLLLQVIAENQHFLMIVFYLKKYI